MSIVLQGSTSGSITLQEPAIAGSTVLSLPATSGTILTTGSSGQSIPKAALPTGSVLQVVSANYSTETSSNSTTLITSGLSATITPTSNTSKILILISAPVGRNTGNTDGGLRTAIYKNGSNLQSWTVPYLWTNTDINFRHIYNVSYIDSPATTSATTYALFFAANNGSAVTYTQIGNQMSTIILMEIAA